jgi:hypothetical protein
MIERPMVLGLQSGGVGWSFALPAWPDGRENAGGGRPRTGANQTRHVMGFFFANIWIAMSSHDPK